MSDCNDTQPSDDSPEPESGLLETLIRKAMERSGPLVRDAMRLGRETCRPDPMLWLVLR